MRTPSLGVVWVLAVVCVALLACKSGSKAELTQARLGTLSGSGENLKLRQETTRLPLIPSKSGDTAKNFGICFHYKEPAKLGELAILVAPPGAIKTGSVELEQQKVGHGVRMKLPAMQGDEGDFCQEMFFEAGDPPGKWRFELQQGATTVKSWDIDVYTP